MQRVSQKCLAGVVSSLESSGRENTPMGIVTSATCPPSLPPSHCPFAARLPLQIHPPTYPPKACHVLVIFRNLNTDETQRVKIIIK